MIGPQLHISIRQFVTHFIGLSSCLLTASFRFASRVLANQAVWLTMHLFFYAFFSFFFTATKLCSTKLGRSELSRIQFFTMALNFEKVVFLNQVHGLISISYPLWRYLETIWFKVTDGNRWHCTGFRLQNGLQSPDKNIPDLLKMLQAFFTCAE